MDMQQVDFSLLAYLIFITVPQGDVVAFPGHRRGEIRGHAGQNCRLSFHDDQISGLLLKQNWNFK